jgi:hypothetical protein
MSERQSCSGILPRNASSSSLTTVGLQFGT